MPLKFRCRRQLSAPEGIFNFPARLARALGPGRQKKENRMRTIVVAVLATMASVAMADDSNDAHRQAVSGRDSYWNCLAQQYSRDSNRGLSGTDFATLIASAYPSERQNFRVMLLGFLSTQFPEVDAGAHMTTANNAIASAQRDVVKAFVRHQEATK
jgi:hypothetical protein